MLRVHLLGELALDRDGEPLPAPAGRRARELLAWLALHPGAHARSDVAARLWPDVLDSSARASLRTALHELRQALGPAAPDALMATRAGIGLAGAPTVWVDAIEVTALLDGDRPADGLALCRGEPLPGIDEDWARTWSDEHRERVAGAYERLARAAEADGDPTAALGFTRELVRLDPLSEQAHRLLMQRLAAAGDRPAALAAYTRLAERLRRELGVAPSGATRALADELRATGTEAAPTQSPPPAPAPATGPPPLPAPLDRRERTALVGRETELARLEELLGRDAPRPLVLLAGEPGIGKTRLIGELGRRAHARGGTVLFGRCYEETLTPYQPFVEALDRFVREGGATAAAPAALAPLVPAADSGTAGRDTADPQSARWRLFEAASAYLRSAAPAAGLVVLLDDLHWADHATLLLLAHLVRSPGPEPVILVGTYRDTELGRTHPLAATLADLRRDDLVERVVLRGLGEPDCAQMVLASLGPTPERLVHTLHEETAGNPFYLGEVLRHIAEAAPGRAVEGIAGLGIPEGVKEVIGRRLSRLGEDVDRVLAAAAVLGRTFDLDVLEQLDEMRGDTVLTALERARAAQIVREEPGRPGRYSFAHPLIRETLYEELSLTRRVRLHRAIAVVLEELRGEDDTALLAGHALEGAAGGNATHAVDIALRAARAALGKLAYEEAAATCRRALEVLTDAGAQDSAQHAEVLLVLGDALVRSGDRDASRENYGAAAHLARALGDPGLLARAALGFSGPAVSIIAVDEASVSLLEEALATLGADDALRARLLGRLAIETYYVSTPARRAELGDEAVALARRTGDAAALAEALNARHAALWSPAYLDERLQTAREMVRLARDAGDPERELQGRNWLVSDLGELGDLDAMRVEIAAHEDLVERLRLRGYAWWGPMWRMTLALLEGRFGDADALLAELTELAEATSDPNADLYREMQWVNLTWSRDGFSAAHWLIEETMERERDRPADWAYRAGFSWAHAGLGEHERARELLAWLAEDDFARVNEDMNLLAGLSEMANAIWLVNEPAWARPVYERLAPYADRNVLNGRGAAGYGCAAHMLGLLAWTMGDDDRAAAHLEHGIDRNTEWGAKPWADRGREALAALRAGERPGLRAD